MAVAERSNGMPAIEVQDAAAVARKDVAAAGPFRHERELAVHRHHQPGFAVPRVAHCEVGIERMHQVHPGAGLSSPVVWGRPHRRFIHWTAPPAAPLTRLSIADMTTTVSPSVATPM